MLTRSNSTLFTVTIRSTGRYGSEVRLKVCRNEIAKGIPVEIWNEAKNSKISHRVSSASIVADGDLHRIHMHRRSKDTR